jgi:methionyl-tRNA formyltransferase
VESKWQAVRALETLEFDFFVSCGFPFILPISRLKQIHPNSTYVNIHPSLLPDLRGADPIPGAILFRRDSGVSCHLMDDGIDTGPIISQLRIPFHESIDSRLLYHLCFQLEPSVFFLALEKHFQPLSTQPRCETPVYYSFIESDLECTNADSDDELVARIHAFNTPRKGAIVSVNGELIRIFLAHMLPESAFLQMPWTNTLNEIVAVFADSILVRRHTGYCRLSGSLPENPDRLVGQRLFT